MAKRNGQVRKGVEEKRRQLPIYEHFTLSPGKTKSHHPEARCKHCRKEFVCGSKQRLIRHLRKCNSVDNSDEIIAETLNTLARNSATGTLNHSILEASNLLPSQVSRQAHQNATHQLIGQQLHTLHHTNTPISNTSATSNTHTTVVANQNANHVDSNNYSSSGNSSGNDTASLNASNSPNLAVVASSSTGIVSTGPPAKRPRRGSKKGQPVPNPTIHVTTGTDGKTHFTPASQLPISLAAKSATSTSQSTTPQNGRRQINFDLANFNQMSCATLNHSTPFKYNQEHADKAFLRLVLTKNLPLALCDTKEFQAWVRSISNNYEQPKSTDVIAHLKKEAQASRQRVFNILVKAPKKTINLELQNWTEPSRGYEWFAIIAYLDHKRFLISLKDVSTIYCHKDSNNKSDTSKSENQASSKQNPDVEPSFSVMVNDCIKRFGSDRVNCLIFSGAKEHSAFGQQAQQVLYASHPSIVTYHCWWNFTNSLCSDIIEQNETFLHTLKYSKRMICHLNRKHGSSLKMERFRPFANIADSTIHFDDADQRWYSHLVCYLLQYINDNSATIMKALERDNASGIASSSSQSRFSHDNNNNSNNNNNISNNDNGTDIINSSSNNNNETRRPDKNRADLSGHLNSTSSHRDDVSSKNMFDVVLSPEYWTNVNSVLTYLKPIQDILALTSAASSKSTHQVSTSSASSPSSNINNDIIAKTNSLANLSLGEYMHWFISYGKILMDSWRSSQDHYKYRLIGRYLSRFNASMSDFKLLIAAYLLHPVYKCAYMTKASKDIAIEEILNIASEFMPEESDGRTIFDQWKLYLVREEPYDVAFDDKTQTALSWWQSLPCAESIRRVALRILRMRAYTSPQPKSLFSQVCRYVDNADQATPESVFEDVAILRYFYDYEDRIGHGSHMTMASSSSSMLNSTSVSDNDRPLADSTYSVGDYDDPNRYLPSGGLGGDSSLDTANIDGSFNQAFSDIIVEKYMCNNDSEVNLVVRQDCHNLAIENLPGYSQFSLYFDYNVSGVHIAEEPTEKKKRKWTAQEILSKCQVNNQSVGAR